MRATLNAGQASCADAIDSGENLLILGGGGVGKSYLLRYIKTRYGHETVFMSTTGITAINIGGMTSHRALALPIGYPETTWLRNTTKTFTKLWKNRKAIKRIVLDEVSMSRSDTFTCIDLRLRNIFRNDKPFGGLQVILAGDIFQIPPVINYTSEEGKLVLAEHGSEFFFHTKSFLEGGFKVISLTESMRTEDKVMKKYLDDIRFGTNLNEAVDFFNTRYMEPPKGHNLVTMVCTNREVDRGNARVFRKNPNREWHYSGMSEGIFRDVDKSVPDLLQLKEGIRVMSLVNTPSLFQNGSCGTVKLCATNQVLVDFDDIGEVMVTPSIWENCEYVSTMKMASSVYTPEELDEREIDPNSYIDVVDKVTIGRYTQMPLRQANFITAHKAQGSSLNGAIIDLGYGAFVAGQAYTMLSRLTGMDNMYLDRELSIHDVIVCKEAVEFYEKHAEAK